MPPAVGSGRVYHIKNNSANFHVLYPAPGAQFSNFGANAGYAVFPLQVFSVVDTDTNQFDIISNLPLMYPIFFFAARAGGGQALATQLGYGTNVITTCATAADSVKMPIALGGTQPTVVTNYGAASCRIHAASNGYLNNVLNGTYDLAPGKTATFWDTGPLPQNTWSGGAFA